MFGHLKLEFGAYLRFACLPVGREFVILDFRRCAFNPRFLVLTSGWFLRSPSS